MNKLGLEGADKFFHCKGNYEAAKKGRSLLETCPTHPRRYK